ncbi:LAQU0S19e01024g1_1 [Lachancea quebecensis]|uniref:LAQU0S19e01024g1_1 n=1 Tax=Lachancea quebecensis TaxID=1654605 RepID=A0A0P1KZ55_9SACH|nr:LAQU0S19e01024g1_1 [Lachancea quebecensis]
MHSIDPYEWQLDQELIANTSQPATFGTAAWSDYAILERSTSADPLPKLAPLAGPAGEGIKRTLDCDDNNGVPAVAPGKRTRRDSREER